MKRVSVIYIFIPIFLLAGFLFYKYLINVYETYVNVEPDRLYADNQSEVVITLVPVNSMGWKALFRSSPGEFEIIEGKSLAEIKSIDEENGRLVLKAKTETGTIVIKVKSKYSMLPMRVEINVYPNFT